MVLIAKDTKWECQKCGRCCIELVPANLGYTCRHFDSELNTCGIHENKPLSCKLYPFEPDASLIAKGKVRKAFSIKNMIIQEDCPGIGYGKKVHENRELKRVLNRIAKSFAKSDRGIT